MKIRAFRDKLHAVTADRSRSNSELFRVTTEQGLGVFYGDI
jgi:hypothetical protein